MTRHPHSALFYRSPFSAIPASLVGLCLVAAGCGSGGGTVADQPLVIPEVSEVAAGDPTCPAGGVRVQLGADDNRDGDLDDDEVDSTSYVCNGTDMVGGEDNVLVRTVELPLNDAACPAGGRRLDVGLDNGDGTGLPDNDILEDDEVDTSFLDCNGTMTVVVTPPTGNAGTFVDVANFCMFLHSLGHGIAQISQQEQPASVDAYVGAREDAAIWKKRALEAEELNRKFIADVNGPTYLGEPVKQEQPAERDGIPEWTPAIGIECAILNLNDNAMRLRHGSHAPLQIADDLDVIATSLAGCLPVAQQGAQS